MSGVIDMVKLSVLFENPKREINVAAIARTCDFFGCDYYVSKVQKHLSVKQSAGVIINKPPMILDDILKWKGRIIATDSSFEWQPQNFSFQDGDLIVFGNEATGVSREVLGVCVSRIGIPSKGSVPCLNVAAAVAAILSRVI